MASRWYSAAPCRGLIEAARDRRAHWHPIDGYSAAPCRGLIEAVLSPAVTPILGAALYSAAPCRGLIEARSPRPDTRRLRRVFRGSPPRPPFRQVSSRRSPPARPAYSAAPCRGLIEASSTAPARCGGPTSIPRLRAAASLKPQDARGRRMIVTRIPRLRAAASLKPLRSSPPSTVFIGIPRLRAAASLKQADLG